MGGGLPPLLKQFAMKRIPKDKLLHFAVNFIISYSITLLVYFYTLSTTCAIPSAFFASSGLSLGKEYGDKNASGNHWCWWDLLADFIGYLIGILMFYLTIKIA